MIPVLKEIETDSIGNFISKKASISNDGLEFIIDALSDNLYSNIINTIVREYSSNMMDAIAIENKLDKPCYVIFSKNLDDDTHYIEFKDFGSGMTPEFMNTVFMNWGDSTKRKDNIQIGGFGLGSKCGLAYQDQIYITTIVNNNCWEYLLYKTEKLPELVLLNSYITDQPNGTSVKIEIKHGDIKKFYDACNDELFLFKNIIVIDLDNNYNNNRKIYEHDLFYFSGKDQKYIVPSISVGSVVYAIDTYKLKSAIDESKVDILQRVFFVGKIFIKVNIGEIDLTLSRENIKYTEKTIRVLVKKILELDEYFKNYIFKYFNENTNLLARASRNFYIVDGNSQLTDDSLYLNFHEYVDLYYKEQNRHFFETNFSLTRKTFSHSYFYSITDYFKFLLKKKYYVNVSHWRSVSEIHKQYIKKYFCINNSDSILFINDKTSYLEYENIYLDEHFTSIGYKVLAKQQLINQVKNNLINLESVPNEYIIEQEQIDINTEKEKRRLKAQIAAEKRKINRINTIKKDNIIDLDTILSRHYYPLKPFDIVDNDYYLMDEFGSHNRCLTGKDLINLDFVIFIKNFTLTRIVLSSINTSDKKILIIELNPIKELDSINSLTDIFNKKYKKEIDEIVKVSKKITFIKNDKDIFQFLTKHSDKNLIKRMLYSYIYDIDNYVSNRKNIFIMTCIKDICNVDLSGIELTLDKNYYDNICKFKSEIINIIENIPKFNNIYIELLKTKLKINPAIDILQMIHFSYYGDILVKKYYPGIYYFLKSGGITTLKPFSKIKKLIQNEQE